MATNKRVPDNLLEEEMHEALGQFLNQNRTKAMRGNRGVLRSKIPLPKLFSRVLARIDGLNRYNAPSRDRLQAALKKVLPKWLLASEKSDGSWKMSMEGDDIIFTISAPK